MNAAARLALVAALLIAPDAARAHPAFAGADGFTGGLLHPFFVLAHALAIGALGLLIGRQKQRRLSLIAFTIGLAAGMIAIANAYIPSFADLAMLALALVTGTLVALGNKLPPQLTGPLAVAIGTVIALDSPPEAMTVRAAIETQLGTFCGASVFIYAVSEIAARLKRQWQSMGIRIIGSWIAACAILVLALQFAK
jgi:urease accessory protein